jgi:O-antigen/teichoic acid export membrane protein
VHERFRKVFPSGRQDAVAGTGWALAGELTRVVSAGATFVLLARLLGPGGFGEYAGTLALVSALLPFSNAGAGHLLVLRVARRPETFPCMWSSALATSLVGGLVCTILVAALRPLLLPRVPAVVVVALALSELLFAQAVEVSAQAFQAHDDMRSATRVRASAATTRVAMVAVFAAVVGHHTVLGWSLFHLGASVTAAVIAVSSVVARRRVTMRLVRPTMADARAGAPFAFGLSSSQIQHDIDKTMLLGAGFAADAGVYAAGHRIIGYLFLPLRAVVISTYPRFLREGQHSLAAAARFARRLLGPTVAFALLAAVCSFVVLPRVTPLLGDGFSDTALVVQALALLPLLQVLQYLAGNSLTGAGHVGLRTALQAGTAGINVLLNLMLIPLLSWKGAVIATYCAEVLLAVSLWIAVAVLLCRRSADHLPVAPATA